MAVNEHAQAAGEFAKAAEGTTSAEALRTLKLLEHHHKKLSQLLKFPSENPLVDSSSEKTISTSAAVAELRASKHDSDRTNARRTPASAASAHIPRRMPARDMSSSIASNLATARGIKSTTNIRRALSPSVSTQQAPGSLEVHARRSTRQMTPADLGLPPPITGALSKAASEVSTTRASAQAEQLPTTAAEEGFQRFYSTVESLLSKISAPLAFAGLPLIAEESSSESTPSSPPKPSTVANTRHPPAQITTHSTTAPPEVDLSKYISRAALRATAGHPASDSFYVVPKTGGTVSYASILTFAEKEKRRMAAELHARDPGMFEDPNSHSRQPQQGGRDEEMFVDAQEDFAHHQPPRSPGLMRRLSTARGATGRGGDRGRENAYLENVVEELHTENKSLKDCIDKLSRRLHAFEMSAQSSTLALQESIRLAGAAPSSPSVHPAPTHSRDGNSGRDDKELREAVRRVKALEEEVGWQEGELRRLGKENEKLRVVVGKYRERWEKLKEGAKSRREGQGQGALGVGGGRDGQLTGKDGDGGGGAAAAGARFMAG